MHCVFKRKLDIDQTILEEIIIYEVTCKGHTNLQQKNEGWPQEDHEYPKGYAV